MRREFYYQQYGEDVLPSGQRSQENTPAHHARTFNNRGTHLPPLSEVPTPV